MNLIERIEVQFPSSILRFTLHGQRTTCRQQPDMLMQQAQKKNPTPAADDRGKWLISVLALALASLIVVSLEDGA